LVKIRLKRMGAKKRPFYRLVVADARSPRDGKFIEELGTYDPIAQPAKVRIDADRVKEWMRKGAQPTETARKLLEMESILPRTARPMRPDTRVAATAAASNGSAAVATAEAPPVVAEEAAAAAEQPVVAAEEPAAGAEEPATTAEEPAAVATEPAEESVELAAAAEAAEEA
jgi:small subunit ribosomal protein S16